MTDHYSVTNHRAARAYRCGECDETIAKGATYVRHVSITSDGVNTHRMCVDCDAWSGALVNANRAAGKWSVTYDGGAVWMWGSLWEAIEVFAEEVLSDEAVAFMEREATRNARLTSRVWGIR